MKIQNSLQFVGWFRIIEILLWMPVVLMIMALLPSRFVGKSPMFAQLQKGMSQALVKAILGQPEQQIDEGLHSKEAVSEWRYIYHGQFGFGWESIITVDFDAQGQVCWYSAGSGSPVLLNRHTP